MRSRLVDAAQTVGDEELAGFVAGFDGVPGTGGSAGCCGVGGTGVIGFGWAASGVAAGVSGGGGGAVIAVVISGGMTGAATGFIALSEAAIRRQSPNPRVDPERICLGPAYCSNRAYEAQ